MGDAELIVEATEEGQLWIIDVMFEDTKHLLIQRILRYAIVMIQARLCRPTDIERRSHVMACPIENLGHLFPIAHLLEIHMLHGGTGNDEAVILVMTHLLKVGVEGLHVLYRCILRGMALYLHETQLDLQR